MSRSRFYTLGTLSLGILLSLGAANSYADEVGALTTFVAKTPAKAADVNENFNAVKNAVNSSHAKIQALDGKVTTQGTDIATLKAGKTAQESEITTLGNAVTGHTTTINALAGTATTQNADIATLKSENAAQATSIGTLNATVSGHTTSLNALTTQGSDIATLKTENAAQATSLTNLSTSVTTHGADITAIKAENTTQGASINSLNTTVGGHTTSINAITNTVNGHTGSLSTLDTDNTTNKGDITSLKSRATKLETHTAPNQCPPDMVPIGPVCIDKYENSVWESIDANVISKIKGGTALSGDLTGVTQRGKIQDDFDSANCIDTASDCGNVYAASVAGVKPSAFINWFQAAAACANSGKRLPTNQEWQVAAFGTPDPGTNTSGDNTCNVSTGVTDNTGARTLCKSKRGAFDMVGNVWEWVADWMPGGASPWAPNSVALNQFAGSAFGQDFVDSVQKAASQGAADQYFPAAILRGGQRFDSSGAGVFTLTASHSPSFSTSNVGFRCAK